jgi:hypothetical protein
LILATNSSNLISHLVVARFWWKEDGRIIGCGVYRTRELQIDWDRARSKGEPNRARKPLGRFGPIFLPAAHLCILDFPPWFVSFWGRHPRDQDRGSSRMKFELYVLVLGDDPSYHLGPCHLWKWFLLALEHEWNSSFAPLNLCDSLPFVHVFLQKHNTYKCTYEVELVISLVPSGGLVANHNRNQCITSTLGWRKFTVNISPMLIPCSSSSK